MRPRPPDPPGTFRAAGLHLAGLSALAVAQPLFDLLARNAEFFAVRGSTRWDIVLFAIGVIVLPPLLLLAVEGLAGLVHARAATGVHLVFLGALVALLVMQAVRSSDAAAPLVLALAAASGAAAAAVYVYARPARMLLTVLAAAPLVFAGLFLLESPVSRLVLHGTPEPRLADVPSSAPVVMVVLDELPTVSLMDAESEIDRERYPNFARLAADATWYRNATTVHEWTTGAVPAILTGLRPETDDLPLYLDHPDNLFTLLGGGYRLQVTESQTHLCPDDLCDEGRDPLGERVGSLFSDLSIVYGHLVLPESVSARLPSITSSWRDFGAEEGPVVRLQRGPSEPGGRAADYIGRDGEVQAFVDGLEAPGRRPTLAFLHTLLPHHPWEYLPNGKVYASNLGTQPGMVDERWVGDPELTVQGYQRHLLQVGYVDLLLGRILDRLEATGQYDDALVVVVADHGTSFRPHGERRRIHAGNMAEIAFVPLFTKAPGQKTGRVVDEHVRTIDVLPTMAELLGVDIPWATDGRSVVDPAAGPREVVVATYSGERVTGDVEALVAERDRVLAHQVSLFGDGDDAPGLYAAGPRPELLGHPVNGLAVSEGGTTTFENFGETRYDPESSFAPVRVYGRIRGAPGSQDIAVAVNGRIAATARSFEFHGETLVSALVPEDALRPGANSVRVYVVDGTGTQAVLRELPAAT
ncbi:MAG: sulfatase-like hydrolase/transferase [Gaiellaceae bacterium]